MLTHTCTCAHIQSTQSPHAHIHTRGGTQPTCSHTYTEAHTAHMLTHTHTEACVEHMHSYTHRHAQSPRVHMEAHKEPSCSHAHAGPIWLAASHQLEARTLPPFLPGPQQQELKNGGHLGRVPMLGDNCGILSPELTVARLSEELAVFLEILTCGHFPVVLLQLNGQHEGRPLSCVHHLWTQNCDPRGLCCREQSTQMCVWGLGWGLRVCIGTPHALSRCSAPSLGHPDEGGVDGMAIRAGVFMDAMNPILRVSSEPT